MPVDENISTAIVDPLTRENLAKLSIQRKEIPRFELPDGFREDSYLESLQALEEPRVVIEEVLNLDLARDDDGRTVHGGIRTREQEAIENRVGQEAQGRVNTKLQRFTLKLSGEAMCFK